MADFIHKIAKGNWDEGAGCGWAGAAAQRSVRKCANRLSTQSEQWQKMCIFFIIHTDDCADMRAIYIYTYVHKGGYLYI